MAFVVVQHLDPRHGSLLPEILAKKTTLPVTAAVDREVIRPDRVYVIPPNTTLTVANNQIQLQQRPGGTERHQPVDALFQSLAAAYAENAIAVVLSGGDADGSHGIQAIKHEGGIVFAQTPDSARAPNMPRNAIETGCVDRVLRPEEIAQELVRLGQGFSKRGALPSESTPAVDRPADDDEAHLRHILRQLRLAHGLDFTHYKRAMVLRRLTRRMMLRSIESLADYRALVDEDPAELAALHQDFLIRVTEFFRDPASFDALREHVFPGLRDRGTKQPIRIWVPGCATGEEVYSLAIALLEFLGPGSPAGLQIFGTDVSEPALEKARAGVYPAHAVRDFTSERLQRFFVQQDDSYAIVKEVRALCIFARQDLTRDPPFSRLDLISCRNVLIYLDEAAQRRVLQGFHFALRPDGMVIFGSAESVGQSSELFEQVDPHVRLYRRRPGPARSQAHLARGAGQHPSSVERDAVGDDRARPHGIDDERGRSMVACALRAGQPARRRCAQHSAVSRSHRSLSRAGQRPAELRPAARRASRVVGGALASDS